jgi:hypothetical protein
MDDEACRWLGFSHTWRGSHLTMFPDVASECLGEEAGQAFVAGEVLRLVPKGHVVLGNIDVAPGCHVCLLR